MTKEKRKPTGYWTLENTLKECRILVEKEGDLPSKERLEKSGMNSLEKAIANYGGFRKIREILGLKQQRVEDGHWTKRNIIKEAKEIVTEKGYFPSEAELKKMNRKGFLGAVHKHYGIVQLRRDLRLEIIKLEHKYWTVEKVINECKKIVRKEGYLPSNHQLDKMGYGKLAAQITSKVGYRNVRDLLKLEHNKVEDGFWKNEENALQEASRIMEEHKLKILPSRSALKVLGYHGFVRAIYKYLGGFTAFREKLDTYMEQQGIELPQQKNPLEELLEGYITAGETI